MFDSLFRPRGVAVIGASHNPAKIGSKVVANILAGSYEGAVYPINPSGGEIDGLPAYPRVSEAPGPVDLACVCVPAPHVEEAVRDCAKAGVRHLAIITSGFSEVGELDLERRIVVIARDAGARVLGPNIFGVYSAASRLNASFGPADVLPGGIAIITQSGALGIAMMGKTRTDNLGLSAVVSVGNKADVDEADLLDYLVNDDATRVILMYIEGVRHGWKLVDVLPKVTRKKPVIVIKSGRSARGAAAAASHTGSLAGADDVFSAIMAQCGALRADNIRQAFQWARFLADHQPPKGDNTVILTNGGGIGVLATDACERLEVPLYSDLDRLKTIFKSSVPEFGSFKNPVDITGGGGLSDYEKVVAAALDEPAIDAAIVLGCETAVLNGDALDQTIHKALNARPGHKPAVFSFVGGRSIEQAVSTLYHDGIPIFAEVDDAVSCLAAAYAYRRARRRVGFAPTALERYLVAMDEAAIQAVIQSVRKAGRRFLLAPEARTVMDALGISLPKTAVARDIPQAVAQAERIGYPVVMKIVSPDIIHKSDAGGVVLDIENEREVIDAFEAIMHGAKAYKRDAKIVGIEIGEQIEKGVETIAGARRDPSFGPVLMFGLGGIYVEVLKDVAFRALPLSEPEARRMIDDIRTAAILKGVRGESPRDTAGVLDSLLRVGALLYRFADIADVEINPLMVYEQGRGTRAVDVRILLTNPGKDKSA